MARGRKQGSAVLANIYMFQVICQTSWRGWCSGIIPLSGHSPAEKIGYRGGRGFKSCIAPTFCCRSCFATHPAYASCDFTLASALSSSKHPEDGQSDKRAIVHSSPLKRGLPGPSRLSPAVPHHSAARPNNAPPYSQSSTQHNSFLLWSLTYTARLLVVPKRSLACPRSGFIARPTHGRPGRPTVVRQASPVCRPDAFATLVRERFQAELRLEGMERGGGAGWLRCRPIFALLGLRAPQSAGRRRRP
jgi:hypothetical protein